MDFSNVPSDASQFSLHLLEQAEREMARMAAMNVPATIVVQQEPLPPWMTQEQWEAEIVRRLEEQNEQLRMELGE